MRFDICMVVPLSIKNIGKKRYQRQHSNPCQDKQLDDSYKLYILKQQASNKSMFELMKIRPRNALEGGQSKHL